MTNAAGNATTYQPGDRVVFDDNMVGARTYTVTALEDLGLRLRLADEHGVDLGWAVMAYDVTPVDASVEPAADDMTADLRNVLDVEAGLAAIVPAAAAAAAAAAAPLDRSRTAGPYRVRIYVTDADQTVRVEVTHSGGGLVRVDTRDGLADMTARFGLADADAAKVVANDTVTLLRAGLSPRAVASLAFNIDA